MNKHGTKESIKQLVEGFDGTIFDNESSLQMLGARMYDNETGRFTTCDPLWAAFPAQSPYSYAYNSPLTWRDPSGLAPEKEKDREKLQVFVPGPGDPRDGIHNEIDYSNPKYNCGLAAMQYASWAEQLFYTMMANGGGGGGGGDRTGATYTYNGSTTTINDDCSESVVYNYTAHIPTSFGTLDIPVNISDSGIEQGETHESVMQAYISGVNQTLRANPKFYDNLWGRDITVNIMHSSEILADGKPAISKHKGYRGTNKSEITLAGDILTGHTKIPYPTEDKSAAYHESYMLIAHEFAHAIHFALTGNNFFDYSIELQELYAITRTNGIQSYHGDPLRITWSPIFPLHIGKSTWWHYQIYGY